jgi:ribosomal protein L30E
MQRPKLTAALLMTVSFARTGRDDSVVIAENLPQCVFRIDAQQYKRLARARKYIYSHGCTGAKSSY